MMVGDILLRGIEGKTELSPGNPGGNPDVGVDGAIDTTTVGFDEYSG